METMHIYSRINQSIIIATGMDGSHFPFTKGDLEPSISASEITKLCRKLQARSKTYYF